MQATMRSRIGEFVFFVSAKRLNFLCFLHIVEQCSYFALSFQCQQLEADLKLEIYREILEFHIATYEALRTQMDYFRYATNF